jgi:hypothetical protein
MSQESVGQDLRRGIRTSVRNNVSAYGFSIMITATFGVISSELGSPSVGEVFLFCGGGISGVTIVEAIASRGFTMQLRGEPSDVVALGSSFSYLSVGVSVGAAALVALLLSGWLGWTIGALSATGVYVPISGIEMALAHRAREESDRT